MTDFELSYALAKQVPSIKRNAQFETDYGTLELDHEDSAEVGALVEKLLRRKFERRTDQPTAE